MWGAGGCARGLTVDQAKIEKLEKANKRVTLKWQKWIIELLTVVTAMRNEKILRD